MIFTEDSFSNSLINHNHKFENPVIKLVAEGNISEERGSNKSSSS